MAFRRTYSLLLIGTAALMCSAETAYSQLSDSTDLTVTVSPAMEIRALSGPRAEVHPLNNNDIVFNNNIWRARSSSATGSTVTLKTNHSFHNAINSNYRRDARLECTAIRGSLGSGWNFATSSDQTDYRAGDEEALLEFTSSRPGLALFFLRITFITEDYRQLHGGDYEMTVIGTITAN